MNNLIKIVRKLILKLALYNVYFRKFIVIQIVYLCVFLSLKAQTNSYTYDNLGRLTQAQYPNGTSVQYSYDANGNRLQHIITNTSLNVDLSLSSLSLSANTLSAGGSALVNVLNSNAGTAAASSHQVNAYLSTDNLLSVNDVLLSNYIVSSVNPNASVSISNWSIQIPVGTNVGSYYLILKTDGNNSIVETNENNNVLSSPLTIGNCPTITITETVTSASCGVSNGAIGLVASGGSAAYQYSLNNGVSFQVSSNFSNLSASTYTCQVKDANGCTKSKVIAVPTSGGNTTIPNFVSTVSSQTVSFSNTSQYATSYQWDFGDGNLSSASNPTHTYASAGNYTVCLTASNTCGSNQYCSNVNVGGIVVTSTDTMKSWEKQYWIKNTASTERFFVRGALELPDSSIVTVGEYFNLSNGTPFNWDYPSFSAATIQERSVFISKVDKKGNQIWMRKLIAADIQLPDYQAGLGKVKLNLMPSGDILFSTMADYGSSDSWIQISQNGSSVTTKKMTYSYGGMFLRISQLFAISSGVIKIGSHNDWNNPNTKNMIVQKYDNSGTLQWTKTFSMATGVYNMTLGTNVLELTNGDLFITGLVANSTTIYNNVVNSNIGFYLKIDASGNHIYNKLINSNSNNSRTINAVQQASGNISLLSNVYHSNIFTSLSVISNVDNSNGNIINSVADTLNISINNSKANLGKWFGQIYLFQINTNIIGSVKLGVNPVSIGNYPYYSYNNLFNANSPSSPTDVLPGLKDYLIFGYTRSNAYDGKQTIVKLDSALSIDCAKYKQSVNLDSYNITTSTIANPVITTQLQTAITGYNVSNTYLLWQDTIICNYHEAAPCNVTASFSKSQATACLGEMVTFTSTSTNAPVLLWRVNGVNSGNTSTLQKTFTTAGNYTIQLIASNYGICPDTSEFYYSIAPALSMTIATTNMSCGQNNGSISVNATGGNSPFSYSKNNGNFQLGNSSFTGLSNGTYTVRVKDANECSISTTATVSAVVNSLLTVEASLHIPNCSATCNGTAIMSSSGGNAPYTYLISPSATQVSAGHFSGLCPNSTYSVTSTDASGCSKTKTITLTSQGIVSSLSVSVSPNDTVCYGTSVTLTASGASTYSWSGGITNGISFIPSSTSTYTVTGSDNTSNCSSTATRLITVNSCSNCLADITISTTPFTTALTESQTWIQTSGTVLIPLGANVKLDANSTLGHVTLNPGFKAEYGAVFIAQAYNGCVAGSPMVPGFNNNQSNLMSPKVDAKGDLILYPNPTSGMITLVHPSTVTSIQVFDMVGKLVMNVPVENTEKTEINLSEFSNGIYHVRTQGFTTIKVIKQ